MFCKVLFLVCFVVRYKIGRSGRAFCLLAKGVNKTRRGRAIWYKEAKRLGDRSQASERGAKVGRDLGIIYFNYQFSRAAPISSTRPCLPVSFTDCRQDACQKTEWPP